ncbi:MAG: helix-turn-helix domain-containing protein [Oscillospiraceae bacterium]|nr:helix-turn-helix domain-containing protein [Oscillospiraceae bacterium]
MEKFNYFNELEQSLKEAVAFKEGDKSKARVSVCELPVPEYKAADVLRVRSALRLSQRGLALALGVSPRTVEAWEVGRNAPNGAARNLLYLIEHNAALVDQLIARRPS